MLRWVSGVAATKVQWKWQQWLTLAPKLKAQAEEWEQQKRRPKALEEEDSEEASVKPLLPGIESLREETDEVLNMLGNMDYEEACRTLEAHSAKLCEQHTIMGDDLTEVIARVTRARHRVEQGRQDLEEFLALEREDPSAGEVGMTTEGGRVADATTVSEEVEGQDMALDEEPNPEDPRGEVGGVSAETAETEHDTASNP